MPRPPRPRILLKGRKVKTIFTTIPRTAILFALALIVGSSSLSKAVAQENVGSFDDILVALEPTPPTQQGGPFLSGPTVINPAEARPVQDDGLINDGLIINGPAETLPSASHYPSVIEPETHRPIETQTAPEQLRNPFLDFETVVEAPTPKHVEQVPYTMPSTAPAEAVIVQREAARPVLVPAEPLPSHLRSPSLKPQTTIVEKTVVTTTTTVVPKSVEPQCPYEQAQRLRQQALYSEARYQAGIKTGYVPYGGRGLGRDYDRYRSKSYPSRSVRYVPVYQGFPSSGYRYNSRSAFKGGRNFSIGIRF